MKLYKYAYYIYLNYFWIISLSAILGIAFGAKQYLISILLPTVWFFLALYPRKFRRPNVYDLFILAILIIDIVSWSLNDYHHKRELIFRHFMGPIAYMTVYFIGRNMNVNDSYRLFKHSMLPAAVIGVVGIYCFFSPPAWYLHNTSNLGFDSLRLRSIFPSPYTITYFTTFLLGYILFRFYQFGEYEKRYNYYIPVFAIVMLLGLMRTPIVAVGIFFTLSFLHFCIYKGRIGVFIRTMAGSLLILGTIIFVVGKTDAKYVEGISQKFKVLVDSKKNYVGKRFNLHKSDNTLFGDGAGRHNIWAESYGGRSMRDGEYQKMKQETGLVGLSIFIAFFLLLIIKCVFHFKYLPFELSVLWFLLMSMIGAAPLSTEDKHCFLFWLIMGRVASFKPNVRECLLSH